MPNGKDECFRCGSDEEVWWNRARCVNFCAPGIGCNGPESRLRPAKFCRFCGYVETYEDIHHHLIEGGNPLYRVRCDAVRERDCRNDYEARRRGGKAQSLPPQWVPLTKSTASKVKGMECSRCHTLGTDLDIKEAPNTSFPYLCAKGFGCRGGMGAVYTGANDANKRAREESKQEAKKRADQDAYDKHKKEVEDDASW